MDYKNLINVGKNLMRKGIRKLSKHSPEILAGLGIASMGLATVDAVIQTPKALKAIEKRKRELRVNKLSKKETIKTAGKYYIRPTGEVLIGAASVVLSVKDSKHRYLALSSAYNIVNESYTIYKDKTKELLGPKKEEKIRTEVAKEQVNLSEKKHTPVTIIGNNEALCMDGLTGKFFTFDVNLIPKKENSLNYELTHGMNYVSLNEYLISFGLEPTDLGYELGWTIDMVPQKDLLKFEYSSILTKDNKPCLVITPNVMPRERYEMYG